MTTTTWAPVVDGDDAEAAVRVVREIAAALAELDVDDPSLAGGLAGMALALAELDDAGLVAGGRVHADVLLERSLDHVRRRPMPSLALYPGLTGVAWAFGRVAADEEPDLDIFDDLVVASLERPHRGHHDVVNGVVGLGVYALDRLPRKQACRVLELVVDRLAALAEPRGRGLVWVTPPELLQEPKLTAFPRGMIDLGLAHGVSGAVTLLAEIHAAGIARDEARRLITGAVSWLLDVAWPDGGPCRYPLGIADGVEPPPTRPAWCYGDTSVAVALFSAGVRLGEADWRAAGHALAREAAGRDVAVGDAGLCHGAAGLAHLYSRFFHATGDELFAQAARDWIRRCLAMRKSGAAVAGFPRLDGPDGPWTADPGLLTGAAGVALALAAAVAPRAPRWDDFVLLSLGSAIRATSAGTALASSASNLEEVNR